MNYLHLGLREDGQKLFPDSITDALAELLVIVSCNPRGMKRMVNLLHIIVVIGRNKPRNKYSDSLAIALSGESRQWDDFLMKCVHWLFLCQNFPFRMSVLLQVLLDFEQKRQFNEIKDDNPAICLYANPTGYAVLVPNVDKISLFQFYMQYVEKYIQAFKKSEKFCRYDKDPEEFAFLLKKTSLKIPTSQNILISCEDVLGPFREGEKERDRMFSLFCYSFNLDPAMRIEVSSSFDRTPRDYCLNRNLRLGRRSLPLLLTMNSNSMRT